MTLLDSILAVILTYPSKFTFKHIDLWTKVIIAFLPIAILGFIFSTQVKEMFSIEIVAWMFISGGIVFLIVEKFYKEEVTHTLDVEDVNYKQAIWIGIAQIFALIPGTSRAGATIIGAMLVGLNRWPNAKKALDLIMR
jgi:undecaprenyl-diphosphatase